jgi:hypothetical protein
MSKKLYLSFKLVPRIHIKVILVKYEEKFYLVITFSHFLCKSIFYKDKKVFFKLSILF